MLFFDSMRLKFKKRLLKRRLRLSNNTQINSSTGAEIRDSNTINWLESNITKYDYSDFKKLKLIGRGSFGSVVRANLKDRVFALKSFNNDETYRVIRELKLHKVFENHENILRFYGFTIIDADPVYQMNKYCLVLEYADSGTLNAYLSEHFNELNWKDKLSLAFQLVNAVSCLHDQDILHRDLHANNILIHQKTVKLADFGFSTKETPKEISNETSNASHIFGIIPYIDPKRFIIENYKLNKKSDVYSIGMLLWQISSGRQPFCNVEYDIRLSLAITNGKREEIIEGTPIEYSYLYADCWKDDPNERPDIKQVASILESIKNGFDKNSTVELSNNLRKSINDSQDNSLYIDNIYSMESSKHGRQENNKININKIDLKHPTIGKSDDKRGKGPNFVIRKTYKGQEVACKSILDNEEEVKSCQKCSKTQRFFETLMKLSECKHIIRFFGISTIEDRDVMVFEWAERGTLRHLYEQKDIKWYYKVRIALNICRGLVFLQEADILLYDLKCQNILITESLEPKICNFELEHYSDGNATSIDLATAGDILPWLAPETLSTFRYTTQCEIFSFGMLLWELTFEKIPYKGWNVEKIKDHVINGGREKILFGGSIPKIYQEGCKKIISESWKQNPQERISFMKLLGVLEELYNSIRYMFDDHSLGMLPDKTLDNDLDDLNDDDDDDDLVLPDEDDTIIKQTEEPFKNKDHQNVWECFDFKKDDDDDLVLPDEDDTIIKKTEENKDHQNVDADEGNSNFQLSYHTLVKCS